MQLKQVDPQYYTPAVDEAPVAGPFLLRASLWKILLGYYSTPVLEPHRESISRSRLSFVSVNENTSTTLTECAELWERDVREV